MTIEVGNDSLVLAVLLAAGAVVAAISAARFGSPSFFRAARWAMGLFVLALTVSAAALTTAKTIFAANTCLARTGSPR